MKIAKQPNIMSPSFGCTPQISNSVRTNKVASALKELAREFKNIGETGKFDSIEIKIESPIKNSPITDTWVIIESSAKKNDLRTRVLTFMASSPFGDNAKRSIAQATGNKFALDAVLKDNSTITAFKNFIRESERFFLNHYSL